MTYEIGQKILVEATVNDPRIDGDGDIRARFGKNPDDWNWVSAAKTREIPVEPTPIAFRDVRVGDTVRVTRNSGVDTYITTGVVADVWGNRFSVDGSNRHVWTGGFESIELISRPEPEPIKVDDKITLEQVKTLPVGSVVSKDDSWQETKERMVTQGGLYNPKDAVSGWGVYGGDYFTVKYIAEQA